MILLDGCQVVVTMDAAGTELENGSVLIDGGVISWVGQGRPPVREQPEVVDGRGLVALPGLINTHHHLYQTLTRVRAQQAGLFDWLRELYPIWATIDADWERTAAEVGLAELALSGCSTTTDHHYVFPEGVIGLLEAQSRTDSQIAALVESQKRSDGQIAALTLTVDTFVGNQSEIDARLDRLAALVERHVSNGHGHGGTEQDT